MSAAGESRYYESFAGDLNVWRLRILKRIYWFCLVLGFPLVAHQVVRPIPETPAAVAIYCVVLAGAFIKPLGYRIRVGILLSGFVLTALISLEGYGMGGAVRIYLVAFVGMTGLLLGFRAGFWALILSIVIILVNGYLIVSGYNEIPERFREQSDEWASWTSFTLSFVLIAGLLLYSSHYLFKSLGQLTADLRQNLEKVEEERQEKEALQRQLFASQKLEAVGQLAGGIAHDFNNLLSAVNGYTELMQQSDGKPEEFTDYLAELESTVDRGAALTKQLLAFGRKQPLTLKDFDANGAIADVGTMLSPLLPPGIDLNSYLEAYLPAVYGDRGQFEQVLTNLIINARDAIGKNGTICVQTAIHTGKGIEDVPDAGDYVMIRVEDTGDGIPEDLRERIFEPFFSTKDDKGTGLGLAVVYGIVKQHDGHVMVESEMGEGTTFTLFWPAAGQLEEVEELEPGGRSVSTAPE